MSGGNSGKRALRRQLEGPGEVSPAMLPIAIVGMACRFPGGSDLDSFWRLLDSGGSAVTAGRPGSATEPPPEGPGGATASPWGAFLEGIDRFDAGFFRIAPVEARLMDPQHRLLLETSWAALEDAGIDPGSLKGSRTSVFAGVFSNDYRELIAGSREEAARFYAATGNSDSTAVGRVAFSLGLEGPAMAVDTACSSSLVAMHQALAVLQRGEADLALAGGVNAVLAPTLTCAFTDGRLLAADGRCKAFDAAANGYVRGEGCGVVVLKRLSEAEACGDRIWAVVRGSAVNQDGASAGLTAPSLRAQERVIEEALERAGVLPSTVDYLEAHGTGTVLGDPTEMQAAGTVYGRGRKAEEPLLVGSVKTNIGHLESAAGVAGLIKVVLSMGFGKIPKHLNFEEPNPRIDWDRLPVRVTSEARNWPLVPGRPARAGVSSFGFSGTNAHVVVESYGVPAEAGSSVAHIGVARPVGVPFPEPDAAQALDGVRPRRARLLPLSGKAGPAVAELAARYLAWLDGRAALESETESGPGRQRSLPLSDMAWTASIGRAHFEYRAGVVFGSPADLRRKLEALAGGGKCARSREVSNVAFVYTGQGSQWVGMGQALYESEPAARLVLDRCETVVQGLRGASLLDVMFGRRGAAGDLHDTAWTQPALYALECALTAVWETAGITPDAVLGHSVGELAAAHVAGVFGLEDGLRFAAERGALMAGIFAEGSRHGAMAAVFAPPEQVRAELEELNAGGDGAGLSLAAENGTHRVVSGPADLVQEVSHRFEARGARVSRLNTSHAFHSALMGPMLDGLESALEGVALAKPKVALISNVTGRAVPRKRVLDGGYWRRQAREPVAFAEGVAALAGLGVDLVVEIGPRPVLGPMVEACWPSEGGSAPSKSVTAPVGEEGASLAIGSAGDRVPPALVASMRQSSDAQGEFAAAAAEAYEAGAKLAFRALFAGEARCRLCLPTYPFQRERYWVDPSRQRRLGNGHPLLGVRRDSASGEITFETELFPSDPKWLGDYRVFGMAVAPGTLQGAFAATAASSVLGSGRVLVEDFRLHAPLILPLEKGQDTSSEAGRTVQVVIRRSEESPECALEIHSIGADEDGWRLHGEGRISAGGAGAVPGAGSRTDLGELKAGLPQSAVSRLYRALQGAGVDLGTTLRVVAAVWSEPGQAIGEVALPPEIEGREMALHPVLLDGCFQVMVAALDFRWGDRFTSYMPFGWERLWHSGPMPARVTCQVRVREPVAAGGSGFSGPRYGAAGVADIRLNEAPEVLTADLLLYDDDGTLLGGVTGLTVKRASRSALLAATENVSDLLYETVWQERPHAGGLVPADFLARPQSVMERVGGFNGYLEAEGLRPHRLAALIADLERLAQSYALETMERLGWRPSAGAWVSPSELRPRLKVAPAYDRLFHRLCGMLADAGALAAVPGEAGGWFVAVGSKDELSDESLGNPAVLARRLAKRHPHGSTEIGLLRRCGPALADVLRGRTDPLEILFGGERPSAADVYREAPAFRAANRMVAEAVAAAAATLPNGRRLRVLEVGAGTGSATVRILPALPTRRVDYVYTDVSAGFFAGAEALLGESDASIEYRVLDIESDPAAQGFDAHGYAIVIAANALHATRDLAETLAHCRALLAPSGQLIALECMRRQGWLDFCFGPLEGWWRFADRYRSEHVLADARTWKRALGDAGFCEVAVLGANEAGADGDAVHGVIVARCPAEVVESPGTWVLASAGCPDAPELAARLAAKNQTVVLAGDDSEADKAEAGSGFIRAYVGTASREAWRSLLEGLPEQVPLRGVVHLAALEGRGASASTAELAEDTTRIGAGATALEQGLADSPATEGKRVWFVTRGAQVVGRERGGNLVGATLWGFGEAAALEAAQLDSRMIDLDPLERGWPAAMVDDLLHPDRETHIAYRSGGRYVPRLVRRATGASRLRLPEEPGWRLAAGLDGPPQVLRTGAAPGDLGPGEIRISVAAAGLSHRDVLAATGASTAAAPLGTEAAGRVLAVGPEVTSVTPGDRVAGFVPGAFGPEAVARAGLVAVAPGGVRAAALATVPTAFVSAALAFEAAELQPGKPVLIHAGPGGVGDAAVQLAVAAGAKVFVTTIGPIRQRLMSLGAEHVFDARRGGFAQELQVAFGGVELVLCTHPEPDLLQGSLSCLAPGGRFVDVAEPPAWSSEEIAEGRSDVRYVRSALDRLTAEDPERVGATLRDVMARVAAGELRPLAFTAWSVADADTAIEFMRLESGAGKVVLTMPPLAAGGLRTNGTYLVTGGLGGVGRVAAEWLVGRGARSVVLHGHRAPNSSCEAAIAALRKRGATVRVELADVTDAGAVDDLLERVDAVLPPLAGVIHCVGTVSDGLQENQRWELYQRAPWPAMLGAWQLHRATADRDLDLFVLFSSLAGVLGNTGQAIDAPANTFLDHLARHRRATGLAGQSIAWGAWSGPGEGEARPDAAGAGWITSKQGLRALDRLVREEVVSCIAASGDWSAIAANRAELPPLLDDLIVAAAGSGTREGASQGDLLDRLRQAPVREREALLESFLQAELQAVLRLPSPPERTAGLFDLGMDSLMAVEFSKRLDRALPSDFSATSTVIFDYPHIQGLARYLAGELGVRGEAPAEPERDEPERSDDERTAIVGMACQFPGGQDLLAFWHQLATGGNAVTDGRPGAGAEPGAELPGDVLASGDCRRWGAFVNDIDRFDARFFRIAPAEARLMDPQLRLLLETSWQALEDAGIDPVSLRESRTGVFVGITTNDYRDLIAASGESFAGINVAAGNSGNAVVGRIAFTLGLEGPAMPIDTACSSSLVAVHQAVAGLQRGETDLALAGGVNAILASELTNDYAEMGMLSSDGKCKTFDASADGFVRGEGCGVVVLKRLRDAEAAGDRIWGVIRGTAVNQNGAGAGFSAPNGSAQQRLIEEALSSARLEPWEVDYLEANGTGTQLGDPIEVQAAASVYGRGRRPDRPLLMGSVKTNIGHLEAAAGIAGLVKVVLSMNRRVIPQHLHFLDPNPAVKWGRLPVRVTSTATAWPSSNARQPLAAVSAFGFSGTNAHVVVEGYEESIAREGAGSAGGLPPAGPERPVPVLLPESVAGLSVDEHPSRIRGTRLLPLSGRSVQAVRDLAGRYLTWLDKRTAALAEARDRTGGTGKTDLESLLADMTWTASVGRCQFEQRAALTFGDLADLRRRLADLAAGGDVARARNSPKVAFVFAGQGGQWAGMGWSLYECEPVARAVLRQCDQVMRRVKRTSLLDVMFGRAGMVADLDDPAWTLPALYALECAVAALWESVGVRPVAVLGHGDGELAAARAAGVFELEDGLRFAATRGDLLATLPTEGPDAGAMAAIFAPRDRVAALVGVHNAGTEGPGLSVAADNSTHQVVSGPASAVEALLGQLSADGLRVERLNARHGFQSGLVEPVLDGIEAAIGQVAARAPAVTIISAVTGRALGNGEMLDGAYWRRQARERVAFRDGLTALARMGVEIIVGIGPDSALRATVEASWPEVRSGADTSSAASAPTVAQASAPVALPRLASSLGAGGTDSVPTPAGNDASAFCEAAAAVYAAGGEISLARLFSGENRSKLSLPTYPFSRRRHWVDPPEGRL